MAKKKINIYYRKIVAYVFKSKTHNKHKGTSSSITSKQCSSIIKKSDKLLLSEKLFLNSNLTIIELAKEIGTNRTYLSIAIKASKQQSFSAYVNSNRIEYSKLLIKDKIDSCKIGVDNTGMTIEDYAIASGFSSARNFVRCFKIKEGITPTQYKNSLLWRVR